MKIFIATLGLTFLFQAAHAEELFPAGNWYAEQSTPSESVYSISHYNSDGTFSIDFRECWIGGSRDHTETGHWSATAGQMHEVTESVTGKPAHLTADYATVSLGDVWVIRVVGGDALRVLGNMARRLNSVPDGSALPTCNPTS